MINYYCPDFFEGQFAYKNFTWLKQHFPECFYDNVTIKSIFGNFPGAIWNGGGFMGGEQTPLHLIRQVFQWYNNQGLFLQLTCTNPLLQETDVYDRYCNAILREASNFSNITVLVSSPILEAYIRKTYPSLKIDKSIIAPTIELNTKYNDLKILINELDEKNYNRIVIPFKYSKKTEYLIQTIPEDKRNRCEILVNDPCPITCPRIGDHYKEFAKVQLFENEYDYNKMKCMFYNPEDPFFSYKTRQYQHSYQEISELLEPNLFSEIKISGRGSTSSVILATVPYLIKPEYQHNVYMLMFSYVSDVSGGLEFDD